MGGTMRTVCWDDGCLKLIDQRKLPATLEFVKCQSVDDVFNAIREMAIRGAPAIGVAGAFGCAIAAQTSSAASHVVKELEAAKQKLDSARPTAVNLAWATQRMLDYARTLQGYGMMDRQVTACQLIIQ